MNLEIWQVISPSEEENQEVFWKALIQHSQLRLEEKKTLFILEQPLFPRTILTLSDAMSHNWKFMFVMNEMNKFKAW